MASTGVDKQWHLTSPTPYDPPLTYGGWNQSRALGVRIAGLLREREQECNKTSISAELTRVEAALGEKTSPQTRQRKQRIIIHSSPFLRCVQTAIAISAGIHQCKGSTHLSKSSSSTASNHQNDSSDSDSRRGSADDSSSSLQFEGNSDNSDDSAFSSVRQKRKRSCTLRLDAFLGEWLTPDYFEHIPPPPGSVMMIASAKADLLRPAETIELSSPADIASASGFFPGGWNKSSVGSFATSLDSLKSSQNLPHRTRSGTFDVSSGSLNASKRPMLSKLSITMPHESHGYVPPTPAYAVKPSDSIPRGYVAHARDACIEVDYQWDSMREPQDWGSGGEYGEEWSSMHRRFRNGLERMVAWYKAKGTAGFKDRVLSDRCDDDKDDVYTVLILVTHGAGCNALIGALTNRPALLDIGISSLTMAVRKAEPTIALGGVIAQQGGTSEVSDEYDVSVLASTDHLRLPTGSAASSPATPRGCPSPNFARPQGLGSISNSINSRASFSLVESSGRVLSFPRVSHHTPSQSISRNRSSSGLWESISPSDPADDIIPNFGDSKDLKSSGRDTPLGNLSAVEKQSSQSPSPGMPQTNHGLWSSASVVPDREPFSKRRWTVTER
ncbi:hypothetical protein PRK78_007544 [Emydomyces testavorans]|uniref:Phosphoglycerate mutase n=1 Tax=Emydomyces testavorans TaxID=2070801 RepID=A0AAF0DPE7_9EURO|nr:hypothetical protein PRK78_007544 [Emydomyces testavorans]